MAENACSSAGSCSRESCEGCPSAAKGAQQPQSMLAPANPKSHVHKVIGVVSGKGGVGKSMVTASLANQMAAQGYKVGILDADITGPSIPKMYGVHGPAEMDGDFIKPVMTANGIEVMSINLLLPDEESPVIWRGPILANMVKQFWSDVVWGELDFLFVDMPPGTRRCSADSVPVHSGRWYCNGDFPAAAGKSHCKKSAEHGRKHAHSGAWSGRKLQLCGLSGLRKRI